MDGLIRSEIRKDFRYTLQVLLAGEVIVMLIAKLVKENKKPTSANNILMISPT